jgi:bifunctional aspartokinase / homoserine dehydrogenase 1
MKLPMKSNSVPAELHSRTSRFFPGHSLQSLPVTRRVHGSEKKLLRVLKFGGTSVGDALSIERVIAIIRTTLGDGDVVVVLSAMAGVTNKLVEAAYQSEEGDPRAVAAIFAELRSKHIAAARELIHSVEECSLVCRQMEELFQIGERLCEGTILLRELTPRRRDAISSLGERLSIVLASAALNERGVSSEAVEATEVVVTDSCFGGADPIMELTRERCEMLLRPILQQGIVPVVTGFIGATAEGTLTTLGRGGSDYSATILGAALDADEVIIWTDVDGLQTADPRQVPESRTIPHISHREAAELAYFGAKVLHPKTIRAVMRCGIPLRIRNTFAPEQLGTKITPTGPPSVAGVKGLSSIGDVVMIKIGGPVFAGGPDVLGRAVKATAAAHAQVLLVLQASSQNELCLIIASEMAQCTLRALRQEFAPERSHESPEPITVGANVALVTVVGQNMSSIPGVLGRTFSALERASVRILVIAQSASECSFSFVVAKPDAQAALAGIHKEFRLGSSPLDRIGPESMVGNESCYQHCDPIPASLPDQGD